MLVDSDRKSVEKTLSLIEARGGRGSFFVADVTLEAQCEAITALCLERYGRVDSLHNNVGIGTGDRGPTRITEDI